MCVCVCVLSCLIVITPFLAQAQHGDRSDTVLSCGLVRGHAYTITDIREVSYTHTLCVHVDSTSVSAQCYLLLHVL